MEILNDITLSVYESENLLKQKAAEKLKINENKIKYIKIIKKSLDARRKDNIRYVYSVCVSDCEIIEEKETYKIVDGHSAVIVGAGPSGLFCALYLARHGIKPIILERGDDVDERIKKVNTFFNGGKLDCESNVQFGEGGAGTFSDGKLNTQTHAKENLLVLQDFVNFGAPQEILYLNKPHIGTDKLRIIIKNIRKEIIRLGGEVHFNTKVTTLVINNGKIQAVKTNQGEIPAEFVILAIGHSSRDTFYELQKLGVSMAQKDFAVGFRVEQLQEVINRNQYGNVKVKLPAADFKLVTNELGRGVFSFCMCPGGKVVSACSEEGHLVVNGMSDYLRNQVNGNSAIVTQVRSSDFSSSDVLSGVEFQREIEKKAFELGGKDYSAPVQLAEDYIIGKVTKKLGAVTPSYPRNIKLCDLSSIYPKGVTDSLKSGLLNLDKKLKGIASMSAVLTGVETRTSSPVRIIRSENYESENVKGLYPIGEGCGYAGGIMSASSDGIRIANAIFEKLIAKI